MNSIMVKNKDRSRRTRPQAASVLHSGANGKRRMEKTAAPDKNGARESRGVLVQNPAGRARKGTGHNMGQPGSARR